MKSFYQFQEDASSQAQSAVSASGSFKGSSDAPNIENKFNRFKKRPSTGLGNYALDKAKAAGGAIKDRMGRPRPEKPQKPEEKPEGSGPTPTDGPGKRPDRAANTYRKSMVAKRTAAAKQPPQHKQISARPASTAMAGSRQKAIGPAKNNLSRDNQGVQKVNVKVEPQKALPPGEGKPMSGGARPRIAPKPQKALAPARG